MLVELWSVGTRREHPFESRQVILVNQLGLLGAAATVLYQLFYLAYDIHLLLPVFLANLGFIAGYLSVLYINHLGHKDAARNVGFAAVYLQLLVLSALLGAGAGIHLYYFTLCGVVYFMLSRTRVSDAAALVVLAVALFLVCQLVFTPAAALIRLPRDILDGLYACSVIGAMSLAGIGSYLIRLDIHNSEKRLAQVNRELNTLSGQDALTGVANRRGLDEALHREWGRMARHRQALSALMCDVDFFKQFNDHNGHLAGDSCLQAVAAALKRAINRPIDLVGRFGGDEFIVVLPDTDVDGAVHLAEEARRVLATLSLPHGASDVGTFVTLSIGISTVIPQPGKNLNELIRHADIALYMAKSLGRNRSVVCVPGEAPRPIASGTAPAKAPGVRPPNTKR
jgi:diguanylate cyclase (GGDEF)-like protein